MWPRPCIRPTELAAHFFDFGLGDHAVVVGIEPLEHLLDPAIFAFGGHLFEAQQTVAVGVVPFDHPLGPARHPVAHAFGTARLGGGGHFLGGQQAVAIGIGFGKPRGGCGLDLGLGDGAVAIGVEAFEQHRGATPALVAPGTIALVMGGGDNCSRGHGDQGGGGDQVSAFHRVSPVWCLLCDAAGHPARSDP